MAEECRVAAYRWPGGADAGDGEGRVEREAGLDGGMRVVKSTKLREAGGQPKICYRIVSVGLDRPSKPRDRLVIKTEVALRRTRVGHPDVSQRIARAEAQGPISGSMLDPRLPADQRNETAMALSGRTSWRHALRSSLRRLRLSLRRPQHVLLVSQGRLLRQARICGDGSFSSREREVKQWLGTPLQQNPSSSRFAVNCTNASRSAPAQRRQGAHPAGRCRRVVLLNQREGGFHAKHRLPLIDRAVRDLFDAVLNRRDGEIAHWPASISKFARERYMLLDRSRGAF